MKHPNGAFAKGSVPWDVWDRVPSLNLNLLEISLSSSSSCHQTTGEIQNEDRTHLTLRNCAGCFWTTVWISWRKYNFVVFLVAHSSLISSEWVIVSDFHSYSALCLSSYPGYLQTALWVCKSWNFFLRTCLVAEATVVVVPRVAMLVAEGEGDNQNIKTSWNYQKWFIFHKW